MKTVLLVIVLAVAALAIKRQGFKSTNDFGMNKPHLLFQLGQRKKVGTSMGFGYWQNHPDKKNRENFSRLRMYYQNSGEGLYAHMVSHDGDGHIHEVIEDRTYGVQTNIRYQMVSDGWQQQTKMARSSEGSIGSQSSYWMNYMIVQNTDHNLIKHFDSPSKTPIYFNPTHHNTNQVVVRVDKVGEPSQDIFVRSSTPIQMFGFSMNISESFDVRGSMEEVKYLIELERYNMKKRKNDSDLVKWQNQQLEMLRAGDWIGKKFVVLVFYGEFTDMCQVSMGNRSSPFNQDHFAQTSQELDKEYFPSQLYPQHSALLKHIIYNLYGGITFYQGVLYTQNSLIRHEFDSFHSFTPSRLIFPRGFLWDDGFHLSIAVHYQPSMAIHFLRNWIKKIDLFGWIGRQQIRGFQMSSLMPQAKFIYQDTFQMNPPTLILPILSLIEKINSQELDSSNTQAITVLLRQNFWKLEKWYRYFLRTQSHNNLIEKEAINKTTKYRWRCKDDCQRGNFMGSGLDDYPRVEGEWQLSKQHVDLMSWIYFFSDGLETIARYLNQSKPAFYYHKKKLLMRKKIFDECLDSADFLFKDQVVKAKHEFIDKLVTKVGYINLFPFFTGVLDQSIYQPSELDTLFLKYSGGSGGQNLKKKIEDLQKKQLFTQEQRSQLSSIRNKLFPEQSREQMKLARKKAVEIMMDPDLLMSQDGIRSLSLSDPLYGTLDNYWRGAVWMPINYLVLRACKKNYWQEEQVQKLYSTLRERLMNTVEGSWHKTGYLYQNYFEGKGNRGFPFYGWSSLIAQVITEQY